METYLLAGFSPSFGDSRSLAGSDTKLTMRPAAQRQLVRMQVNMSNKNLGIDELAKWRTPSELLAWVEAKLDQIGSTDAGERALRFGEGLAKQFVEEVYPLAIFGVHKFGNADRILLRSVIGNQAYDAEVTDTACDRRPLGYIEITQSHEGE